MSLPQQKQTYSTHRILRRVVRALDKLPPDTLISTRAGRVSFNALQHSRPEAHLQFYAFDILIYRGRKLLRLTLESPAIC